MQTFEERQQQSDRNLAAANKRIKECVAALTAALKHRGAEVEPDEWGTVTVNGQHCRVEFQAEWLGMDSFSRGPTGKVKLRKNLHRRGTSREPKGGFDFQALADQLIQYAAERAEQKEHSQRLHDQKEKYEEAAQAIAKRTGFEAWSIDGHSDGVSVDLPHMTPEQAERIVKLAVEMGLGLETAEEED